MVYRVQNCKKENTLTPLVLPLFTSMTSDPNLIFSFLLFAIHFVNSQHLCNFSFPWTPIEIFRIFIALFHKISFVFGLSDRLFCNCFLLFQWNKDNVNPSIRFAWGLQLCFPLIIFIYWYLPSLIMMVHWSLIICGRASMRKPYVRLSHPPLRISPSSPFRHTHTHHHHHHHHVLLLRISQREEEEESVFGRLPLPQIIPPENL